MACCRARRSPSDIERGKTLVLRLLTVGEAGADGQREVFFELNGQPRMIKVVDRSLAPQVPANEKADPANPAHLGAPMPGMVSAVTVREGQRVKAGEVLMSLEAMKMETAIPAPHDGRIARLVAKPGQQVDVRDLLAVLE